MAWGVAVAAGFWTLTAPAADPDRPADVKAGAPVTVGGILTTDGNVNSLMALTDGEEAPVKYIFGEKFDKRPLKGIFSVSRVRLTYVRAGGARTLLRIQRQRARARGTATGSVVFIGRNAFWIAVKPANGPPDGYALGTWPPGEMGAKLKGLHKGDGVRIPFRGSPPPFH